jgi:hypothetical protein
VIAMTADRPEFRRNLSRHFSPMGRYGDLQACAADLNSSGGTGRPVS